jgi:hypothetical protein
MIGKLYFFTRPMIRFISDISDIMDISIVKWSNINRETREGALGVIRFGWAILQVQTSMQIFRYCLYHVMYFPQITIYHQFTTGASMPTESSPVRPAPKTPPNVVIPRIQDVNSLTMSSQRVSQALQRQNENTAPETATVVSSRVTNWQVLEESEEEVILDIDGRRMEVSPAVPVLPVSSAPRASAQMTIGD